MRRIAEAAEARYEVKGSRFLSHLVPIEAFEALRERLRAEHPKASHIVYAYRRVNEYDQIVENSGDDGEPKGCAGAPTLSVLRGAGLVECALLTVRYFGGIKLGTGGMARAYGAAARAAVEAATLLPYEKLLGRSYTCSYDTLRRIEYLLKHSRVTILATDYGSEGIRLRIRGSVEALKAFENEAGDWLRGADQGS